MSKEKEPKKKHIEAGATFENWLHDEQRKKKYMGNCRIRLSKEDRDE